MYMNKHLSFLLSIFVFFAFSIAFANIKLVSFDYNPFFFTGLRMFIVGLGGLVIDHIFYKNKYSHIILFPTMLVGFFGYLMSNVLEIYAVRKIPLYVGSVIYSLCPITTSVMSSLLLHERISNTNKLLVCTATLGMLIVNFESILNHTFKIHDVFIMFCAMVLSCGIWVGIRFIEHKNASFFTINSLAMFFSGIFGLAISMLLTDSFMHDFILIFNSQFHFKNIVTIIIASNVIASFLYSYILKYNSATFISMMGLMSFPITTLIGYLMFNETFGIFTIFGYFIVMASVLLYNHNVK